jgi:hypothetical protein
MIQTWLLGHWILEHLACPANNKIPKFKLNFKKEIFTNYSD